MLLLLCIATFFAVYLGYGRQLLAMMVFYIIASLWFAFFRYRTSGAATSSPCPGRGPWGTEREAEDSPWRGSWAAQD